MKATKAFFALITTAALTIVSCEKDPETIEPVLGDIEFYNINNQNTAITSCAPGETIKAKVKYVKDGKYFKFRQTSSSFNGLDALADTIYEKVFGYAGLEPYVTFKVKDTSGKFAIEFRGQIDRQAGQNINGSLLTSKGSVTVVGSEE